MFAILLFGGVMKLREHGSRRAAVCRAVQRVDRRSIICRKSAVCPWIRTTSPGGHMAHRPEHMRSLKRRETMPPERKKRRRTANAAQQKNQENKTSNMFLKRDCGAAVFLHAFWCRMAECRLKRECADAARAGGKTNTCADAARDHKRVNTTGFHPLVNHPFPLEGLAKSERRPLRKGERGGFFLP